MSKANSYRWDIQGLRAIAMLAVFAFHLDATKMPGGYLGVDIFFVISGYLIIGSIWRSLNQGKFDLVDFYTRRVKRLLPTLFVVLAAISLCVYFLFLPEETSQYAESLIASLLQISNFYFYAQSGYFDPDLEFSPLLHTWSLAVEGQFYILFPLLLILIFRKKSRPIVPALIFFTGFSLILSEVLLRMDESLSFFASPSRFWQFTVGGLIAVYPGTVEFGKKIGDFLALTGLAVIFACFLTYSEEVLFPGINAIVPTLAASLVIVAGNSPGKVYGILSCAPLRFFGNISYSLYLWHWPIILFYRLQVKFDLSGLDFIAISALSVVLGYLSWRFVENPTRRIRGSIGPLVALSCVSLLFCATAAFATNGLLHRYTSKQLAYSAYAEYDFTEVYRSGVCHISSRLDDSIQFNKEECVKYSENLQNYLLIGESHAAHWYSALAKAYEGEATISQVTSSGCRPSIFYEVGARRCTELMRWAYEELIQDKRFDKIILSARWRKHDLKRLAETIETIAKYTDEVVVLGPIVEYDIPLPKLLAASESNVSKLSKFRNYEKIKFYDDLYTEKLSEAAARYISVLKIVCPEKDRCTTITDNDVPVQWDYGHLTHEGALLLLNRMREQQVL